MNNNWPFMSIVVISITMMVCDSVAITHYSSKHENLLKECITRGYVKMVEDVNGNSIYLWHSEKTEGEDAAPNPS